MTPEEIAAAAAAGTPTPVVQGASVEVAEALQMRAIADQLGHGRKADEFLATLPFTQARAAILEHLRTTPAQVSVKSLAELGASQAEVREFNYGRALLNAVVHKDYSSGIPIQISVYDDKIVLWNPGVLPENWTVEKLLGKHPSQPFNPLLANAFFRAGYIEAWGRGIEKMNSACREHGINPPTYDFSMSGLMLTFRANPAHLEAGAQEAAEDELGEKLGEKLGETRAAIVQSMRNDPKTTTKKLAGKLSLSTTAVEKNIHYLKSHGHVRRVGPAKGGYWEVLK